MLQNLLSGLYLVDIYLPIGRINNILIRPFAGKKRSCRLDEKIVGQLQHPSGLVEGLSKKVFLAPKR